MRITFSTPFYKEALHMAVGFLIDELMRKTNRRSSSPITPIQCAWEATAVRRQQHKFLLHTTNPNASDARHNDDISHYGKCFHIIVLLSKSLRVVGKIHAIG